MITTLWYIFMFFFGAIIGSFLNVVILRLHSGKGFVKGRSHCFSCNKVLHARELIPIVSYLAQGGRCLKCNSLISKQYIFVEILTGALFAILFTCYQKIGIVSNGQLFLFLYDCVIVSLAIVIALYDLRHHIIPNVLVYTLIGMSFVRSMIALHFTFSLHSLSWYEYMAGLFVALPTALLFFVSRGKYIGFGDVKLFVAVGYLLGTVLGYSALFIAFWVGALVSVGLLFLNKKKYTMYSEVPFAPFIIFGMLFVFFTHSDVTGITTFLESMML